MSLGALHVLGVRRLNRTTRRLSLTEIGREYYERCAQILQELGRRRPRCSYKLAASVTQVRKYMLSICA
jgi:DNA-binding transcriptional LysR family regulator